MTRIIQKELSYKIVGILFEVHTELGNRYQEKYYQRAIAKALTNAKIKFAKELPVNLTFKGENIGKYFMDFLIENTVILEIKTVPVLLPKDFKQILAYLRANKLELGIIANFRPSSLVYKRILNSDIRENSD